MSNFNPSLGSHGNGNGKSASDYKMTDQLGNSNNYSEYCTSIDTSSSLRPTSSNKTFSSLQGQSHNQGWGDKANQIDTNMPYLSDRNLFSAPTRQQSGQYPEVSRLSANSTAYNNDSQSYLSQFSINIPQNKVNNRYLETDNKQQYDKYSQLSQQNDNTFTSKQKMENQNNPIFNRLMDPTFHKK